MRKNTQRIIAGVLVFLMIAALLVGVFAGSSSNGNSLPGGAPTGVGARV